MKDEVVLVLRMRGGPRLRLLGAAVAIGVGVAAVVVAILLVRGVLA